MVGISQLNSKFYGRYNELDNYGIHGVYKSTYNWGDASCS